jgi:hypothetical protein
LEAAQDSTQYPALAAGREVTQALEKRYLNYLQAEQSHQQEILRKVEVNKEFRCRGF